MPIMPAQQAGRPAAPLLGWLRSSCGGWLFAAQRIGRVLLDATGGNYLTLPPLRQDKNDVRVSPGTGSKLASAGHTKWEMDGS